MNSAALGSRQWHPRLLTATATADGNILNAGLTGNFLVQKKHTLSFGMHWIRSTSTFRGKYSEWRGQLGYSWVLR
ncbi:MAG: hypothetical protein Q7T20_13895 [Saprospiraceae bacterium]|nr:hypothetical protein [Saprospiraceae bacterium]